MDKYEKPDSNRLEPDYIIEDLKMPEDNRTQVRSGLLIFSVILLLIAVPLAIIMFDHFDETYSVEKITGWYEGNLTFQTSENDPEGYYDKYPEYLVAGKIPVFLRLEATGGNEGLLTIIDATSSRTNLEYRIWIEDDKLLGEPLDTNRDVETRLDLFGFVRSDDEASIVEGSLGIKDMKNEAVAVYNFTANRKEENLDVAFIDPNGVDNLVRRMQNTSSSPDISGLWLDISGNPGVRFALFNSGKAFDPEKNIKLYFDQPNFILMYLENEYEVVPYHFDGKRIWSEAEYLVMKNGKIFVTSDEGSYLIDETVFEGDPLIKVKLGDINQEEVAEKIKISMTGNIEIKGNEGFLYMIIEINGGTSSRNYTMMFQLLDL